jgi:hypothetical protein
LKVGIIQSNFLPWRGYFDFIREVDLFIIHDDLQYTKGDWRNRNRIKTPHGTEWITVPVHYKRTSQLIDETTIDYNTPWNQRILNRIQSSYQHTPYFKMYFPELSELLMGHAETISALNVRLIRWTCALLNIDTPIALSRNFNPTGSKTERLVSILSKVSATTYLSGVAAKAYLIPEMFEAEGIKLEFKVYDYPEYAQLYPPYDPFVTILDLMFMEGKQSFNYIKSTERENSCKVT